MSFEHWHFTPEELAAARERGARMAQLDALLTRVTRLLRRFRLMDPKDPELNSDEESESRRWYRERYRMLPQHVRLAVLSGWDCCPACGSEDELTVDHIVPPALGGTDHDGNLWALCRSCNTKKGQRTRAQWRQERIAQLDTQARDLRLQIKQLRQAAA